MLKTFSLTIAAAAFSVGLAGSAAAVPIASPATRLSALADSINPGAGVTEVGYRQRGNRWRPRRNYRQGYRHRHRGGSSFSFSFGYAAPRYYAPRPRVVVSYAPWTAGWYSWCQASYRSFDPRTGYYVAYSGRPTFCVYP